jgi:hypothetical protein
MISYHYENMLVVPLAYSLLFEEVMKHFHLG